MPRPARAPRTRTAAIFVDGLRVEVGRAVALTSGPFGKNINLFTHGGKNYAEVWPLTHEAVPPSLWGTLSMHGRRLRQVLPAATMKLSDVLRLHPRLR